MKDQKAIRSIVFLLILFVGRINAQTTQSVRGLIVDADSKFPIIGASVVVVGSEPLNGAATDENGYYLIQNVPLGRHTLKVTAVGYEEIMSSNALVIAGKQLELNFEMKEDLTQLEEVVVTASSDKSELNNDLAIVSARTFNVEETSRYAGARNDISRMAQNFAGVSNVNDARNDIVIRGNTPAGLLWRLEGIDIPSPNHFASFGSTGGPVSMLNNNNLTKSDFMTAAFPSNYGNAMSGVFDLQMRNGNKLKGEYLGQIGFNGFEFGAEGPLKKGSQASYIVNYRYSTLGVFKKLNINFGTGSATPNYQDINFKVNLPTRNAGRFTIFGVGGGSDINFLGSETDFSKKSTNLYGVENQDLFNKSDVFVTGVSHSYFFNEKTSYKVVVASSVLKTKVQIDSITWSADAVPQLLGKDRWYNQLLKQNAINTHLLVNHKFDARNNLTAGIILNSYKVNFGDSVLKKSPSNTNYWRPIKKGSGTSLLTQAYVTWQHRFSESMTLNSGVHFQYFELGKASAVEPRVGLRYQLKPDQSLNFGFGLHNQIQSLPIYYIKTHDGKSNSNQDLGFTSSEQYAISYDRNFGSDFRIKLETYYQQIRKAPVESIPSSFSMLNSGASFALPDKFNLINNGKGRNYGFELTAEKFYSKQYYFLLTTSLFKSEYTGSDKVWRNTAFNGGYIVNVLGGKEWNLGSKNKTLGINVKLTSAGGRRYTPIDQASSIKEGQAVYFENEAFSKQYADYFRTDIKISFRSNKGRITQEWALDIQNVTNTKNIFQETFNSRTGLINKEYQVGIFPIPQYRILF